MENYRVTIHEDDETSPGDMIATGDDAEDAAYVARFERGELFYVGVVVERERPHCTSCGRGPDWEHVDSLWAIDVETAGLELPYLWGHGERAPFVLTADAARGIPGYLGDVVQEMLPAVASS